MRVILINPPSCFSYNPELSVSYPLGLMYIAATLERQGVSVKIIDFVNDTSFSRIRNVISENRGDIFGISVLSTNRHTAFGIVDIIRKIHRDVKVVLGGAHPTFLYKQILENIDVDAIFLGESELSFLKYVLNCNEGPEYLRKVPGIAFKDDNKNIIATQPEWEKDIDNIPKPAFHLIEPDRYKNKFNEIDFHILASRGCPFRCNFCSVSAIYQGRYRTHSVPRILEELKAVKNFEKQACIMFHDDFFAVDTDRTRQLCNEMIKNNIKLRWTVRSRVDCVDFSTLELMKKSGCAGIFFGVETGSRKILKAMNKNFSFADVKNAFYLTKKAGIKAICNIILGYPGEDAETLNQTRNLLSIIRPDKVYFHPAVIFPGSRLYEQCLEKGLIDDSFWMKSRNGIPRYKWSVSYSRIALNMYNMRISLEDNFAGRIVATWRIFLKEIALICVKIFNRIRGWISQKK